MVVLGIKGISNDFVESQSISIKFVSPSSRIVLATIDTRIIEKKRKQPLLAVDENAFDN